MPLFQAQTRERSRQTHEGHQQQQRQRQREEFVSSIIADAAAAEMRHGAGALPRSSSLVSTISRSRAAVPRLLCVLLDEDQIVEGEGGIGIDGGVDNGENDPEEIGISLYDCISTAGALLPRYEASLSPSDVVIMRCILLLARKADELAATAAAATATATAAAAAGSRRGRNSGGAERRWHEDSDAVIRLLFPFGFEFGGRARARCTRRKRTADRNEQRDVLSFYSPFHVESMPPLSPSSLQLRVLEPLPSTVSSLKSAPRRMQWLFEAAREEEKEKEKEEQREEERRGLRLQLPSGLVFSRVKATLRSAASNNAPLFPGKEAGGVTGRSPALLYSPGQ